MISLQEIETDLKEALKARNQIAADTLRGLKARIQSVQTSAAGSHALAEEELVALVKSEIKRRKEAAESFTAGSRPEMAAKELQEAQILEKYLPAQMSEVEISQLLDSVIAEHSYTSADFGKAMGMLKAKVGQSADGSLVAKLLKEKLTN